LPLLSPKPSGHPRPLGVFISSFRRNRRYQKQGVSDGIFSEANLVDNYPLSFLADDRLFDEIGRGGSAAPDRSARCACAAGIGFCSAPGSSITSPSAIKPSLVKVGESPQTGNRPLPEPSPLFKLKATTSGFQGALCAALDFWPVSNYVFGRCKSHPASTPTTESRAALCRPRITFKKGRLEVALQDVSRMRVHLFRRLASIGAGRQAK